MRRFTIVFAILLITSVAANGQSCPPEGTAKSDAGKTLNRLKNRDNAPSASQIDADVSLASILAPGDDVDRFDEQKGAKIVGFVIDVKPGGKETCNCEASDEPHKDTHIELAMSETAPKTQRVIVEVTPRLRAQMAAKGIDWNTQALQGTNTGIKGKWVEITGWLMFDSMHINEAENTNPGNDQNWRATCWELHPITNIKVLDGPPQPDVVVHPNVLTAFNKPRIAALTRDRTTQEALQTRNHGILAKFDKDELEEDRLHP